MEMITINDIEYYNSEDVFNKAPIYCKDCRNGRELIKNKKIKDFIYAKSKDNKWTITNGKSYKYDKILLLKSFVDTIKEISNPIIVDDKYEVAPDIINLENHEKFKDNDGNIIEIETRGDRKVNSIYFKVKDVMTGFNIEHLLDTLVKNTTSYTENIDYKFFNLSKSDNKSKIKIKKELFLTYKGFQKMIECSRNRFTDRNKDQMHRWLQQNFDKSRFINKFVLNIKEQVKFRCGYVYCITSDIVDYIKIGYWNGLRSRYITYYGNNIDIFYVETLDAPKLENKCHDYFSKYNIYNELFHKEYLSEYKDFLISNKEDIVKFENNTTQNIDNDANQFNEEHEVSIAPPILDNIIYDKNNNELFHKIYFRGNQNKVYISINDIIGLIDNPNIEYS